MTVAVKIRALAALGLPNILRVAVYRLGLKSGMGRVRRLQAASPVGPFFIRKAPRAVTPPPSRAWIGETIYFDARRFPLSGLAPDWMSSPYTGERLVGENRPWWEIPDFDPVVGDIKIIWEPSRFGWVLSAAERAAAGEEAGWNQLEVWLASWCQTNPPYRGPNWKCGQEVSIRVMHLAMAALILDNIDRPTAGLLDFIEMHLKRVVPTIRYAVAQDNNHGTSEAAALFIGGSLLGHAGRTQGFRYARIGRKLIENRVKRLVERDGSFSEHSLTYHRVFLDTLIMAEVWRRHLKLEEFSAPARERLTRAAQWLFAMIDPETGDGPNLGANDGARLLPLTDTGYRDFRPCVQLAMALFCDQRAFAGEGTWNQPLEWLRVAIPEQLASRPDSTRFDEGGYAILRADRARVLLRYPRFRFRPAQSDALHVDLWIGSENLLRDGGTFSYNAPQEISNRFSGVAGHNTIAFDDRDQMPRVGRFLFGEWLKADNVSFDASAGVAAAGYTDWRGASHHRSIALAPRRFTVSDRISGSFSRAVLRWRLAPGSWRMEQGLITDGQRHIRISATMPLERLAFVDGEESSCYLERSGLPVIECEVSAPGTLTSEFVWP